MGITLPALPAAQESLFLTLGGKALDSRLPRPFLGDAMADEVLAKTGYDINGFASYRSKLTDTKSKVFDIAVRTKRLDEVVRSFVARHSDAVVLDLGVGLDTRVFRVDPPATVDWYDVDFPEVIDIRRQVVPPRENVHYVGADVTDPHWMDDLPTDRQVVAVADGLIAFLTHDGMVSMLRRLTEHFPAGEAATNAYTKFAVWAVRHTPAAPEIRNVMLNPGFNDPRDPERWVPGLRLVEEMHLSRGPELAGMPGAMRLLCRLLASSPAVSRMLSTTLLHYRF